MLHCYSSLSLGPLRFLAVLICSKAIAAVTWIRINECTRSIRQSPSLESNSSSSSEDIQAVPPPPTLWNTKLLCLAYKNSPLVAILNQKIPVPTLHHISLRPIILILSSYPLLCLPRSLFLLGFTTKPMRVLRSYSHPIRATYANRLVLFWFDHPSSVWWEVRSTLHIFSVSRCVLFGTNIFLSLCSPSGRGTKFHAHIK